jgi:phosphoserine aminotransferase
MERRCNFNPGPAALPVQVLQEAQEQFVEYRRAGLSLMEMSHRSKLVEELNEETQQLLLELLNLTSGYKVLFMGGGASTQFALVPMNFLPAGAAASYVLTGSFAEKAYNEAQHIGQTHVAASAKGVGWTEIPRPDDICIAPGSAYVHITTNNTIEGSRYNAFPETGGVPLIADMTSDLLGRKLDLSRFALMYAGAQKNLGPAGVTVVIIRDDMLSRASQSIPVIMRYATFAKERSLYNTPPVHAIYMMNLVLKWTAEQGGAERLEAMNAAKAGLLYETIDASGGFYRGIIRAADRSHMNVTWRMADERLERLFVAESELAGFEGLAGHRSVGGLRASAYNAVPLEACRALAGFMADFQQRHG